MANRPENNKPGSPCIRYKRVLKIEVAEHFIHYLLIDLVSIDGIEQRKKKNNSKIPKLILVDLIVINYNNELYIK